MSKYRTEWSKYIAHTEMCDCSTFAGMPVCNCGLTEWVKGMEDKLEDVIESMEMIGNYNVHGYQEIIMERAKELGLLKMEFGMVSQSSKLNE